MNITNNMTQVINVIFNLATWVITQMKNIQFFGTNLLVFCTTITILSVATPILLVLPSRIVGKSERIIPREEKRK